MLCTTVALSANERENGIREREAARSGIREREAGYEREKRIAVLISVSRSREAYGLFCHIVQWKNKPYTFRKRETTRR